MRKEALKRPYDPPILTNSQNKYTAQKWLAHLSKICSFKSPKVTKVLIFLVKKNRLPKTPSMLLSHGNRDLPTVLPGYPSPEAQVMVEGGEKGVSGDSF